jgi:murein DD-endopeptidase MepM/ murein hydrolase activator NlpD
VLLGLPLPATAWAGPTGGAGPVSTPTIRALTCLPAPARACPPDGSLVRGGVVRVQGAGLSGVRAVVFLGRPGGSDDAAAPARRRGRSLEARVPRRARSGSMVALSEAGRSRPRRHVRVTDAMPVSAPNGSRYYFDGTRKPSFNVHVTRPAQARVELVREGDGALVQSWSLAADPTQPRAVRWDGVGEGGPEPPGRYRFRLAGEAASVASVPQEKESGFAFFDHIFPIRGRHNLGYSATNNFGGGRNHQGQDMFARCGTPIAAARGGNVEYAGFNGAAGYYVVIDGRDTGFDYVFMHMRRPPLVRTGERVRTAQQIGEVGETGRAQGCHLHFELWTAPGWYSGGRATDPLPNLKRWDAYS